MGVVETSKLSVRVCSVFIGGQRVLVRDNCYDVGVHRGRCIGEIPPNPVKPVVVCYVRIFVLKTESIEFRTNVLKNSPDVREI